MTITVDQQICNPLLSPNATLGDAMAWLQESLGHSGKIVVKVEMDGCPLDGPALTTARSWPINQRSVAFFTASQKDLARTMIGKLAALVEYLQTQHGQIAQHFEQNQSTKALSQLSEVISAWGQIHQAFTNLVTMLKIDMHQMQVGEMPAAEVMSDFAAQLTSMKDALVNQDMVLLADILQYEMDGAVATWVGLLEATLAHVEG